MTKREMYVAIANGTINDEIMAKAVELIAAEDAIAASRHAKAAEKRAEKLAGEATLVDAIVELLGEEPMTASDIKGAVEGIATAQKATVLAKRAIEAGRARQVDVKKDGRKVKGYVLA